MRNVLSWASLEIRLLIIAGLLSLGLIVYTHFAWRQLVQVYTPYIDNIIQTQVNLAESHLWYEEYISGDDSINPEIIWALINEARDHVDLILDGGQSSLDLETIATRDPELKLQLQELKLSIDEFRNVAEMRLKVRSQAQVGSELDQLFDSSFKNALSKAKELDRYFHQQLKSNLTYQDAFQVMTLLLWLGMFGYLTTHLATAVKKRNQAQFSLQEANAHLEEKVHERTAELEQKIELIEQQKRELVLAKNAADASARTKSEFLSTMSHEIRTPMNGVIGMASLLKETGLNETQHEYLKILRSSADALLVVINDILDFNKMDSGMLTLEMQPVDIQSCIDETLELLSTKANEKGIDLIAYVDDNIPGYIESDAPRIKQVLTNLIANAIKFTTKGQVLVSVTPGGASDEFLFRVKDSGIGIGQDTLPRLFQPFTQADSSTTRKYGGTGLGLAICKRLVNLLGGEISVESEPGKGSDFKFNIKGKPLQIEHNHSNAMSQLLHHKRVLVIDDNQVSLTILGKYLESWNIETECFTRFADLASALLSGSIYDCAIVDYHMPEHDGVHVARFIREKSPACPIILLRSATDQDVNQNELFAARINKPVKKRALQDALIHVVTGAHGSNP